MIVLYVIKNIYTKLSLSYILLNLIATWLCITYINVDDTILGIFTAYLVLSSYIFFAFLTYSQVKVKLLIMAILPILSIVPTAFICSIFNAIMGLGNPAYEVFIIELGIIYTSVFLVLYLAVNKKSGQRSNFI